MDDSDFLPAVVVDFMLVGHKKVFFELVFSDFYGFDFILRLGKRIKFVDDA